MNYHNTRQRLLIFGVGLFGYVGQVSANEPPQEIGKLVSVIEGLSNIFEHSKLTFTYNTIIGEDGIAYYQGKALKRAEEVGNINTAKFQKSLDPTNILSFRKKSYDVSVLTQGEAYAIEISSVTEGEKAEKRQYRTDGSRYYISSTKNRWDIISSDTVPVATPADVLMMPNVFSPIPLTRSSVRGQVRFTEWLREAINVGSVVMVDNHTARFAGPIEPKYDDEKIQEIVEIKLNGDNIASIKQWRISEKEFAQWKSHSPNHFQSQTLHFDDYRKLESGLTIPTKMKTTFYNRWGNIVDSLSNRAKENFLKLAGPQDAERVMDVVTHVWKIGTLDLSPKYSDADFMPPNDETTVIYDYLDQSFKK